MICGEIYWRCIYSHVPYNSVFILINLIGSNITVKVKNVADTLALTVFINYSVFFIEHVTKANMKHKCVG